MARQRAKARSNVTEYHEELNAIVTNAIETLKFTNAAALAPSDHKKLLGDFYKKELNFNPYAPDKFDVRFIKRSGSDPIYAQFEDFAKTPHSQLNFQLFPLKALSGGGKTGVMLNAVGCNQYLIYVECCTEETVDVMDYHDEPFQRFIATLDAVLLAVPVDLHTRIGLLFCQAFWLCRLMILQQMQAKHKITPEEWIYWTNNGGQKLIQEVPSQFLMATLKELQEGTSVTPAIIGDLLTKLVNEYLEATQAWIAIDEAQIAHSLSFNFRKLSYVKKSGDSSDKRSLLHLLSIYALPSTSKRIIAGTSMSDFEKLLKSGAGKGGKVFWVEKTGLSFPYVEPEDAWQRLQEYFDFSDVAPASITKAKEVLQGRLQYVFGFIRQLGKVRAPECFHPPLDSCIAGSTTSS